MNKMNQLKITLLAAAWLFVAQANSQITHTDYSPTYRILNQQGFISYISYTKREIVFHICYVNKLQNAAIPINTEIWTLTSNSRSRQTFDYQATTIKNTRLNNQLEKLSLSKGIKLIIEAKEGDAVTFQVHFNRPPEQFKAVNLQGLDLVTYYDVMLKNEASPFLGNYDYTPNRLKAFYTDCEYVRYPKTLAFTSLEEELRKLELEKKESASIEKSKEKINYIPENLEDIENLICEKRVILNDIYFKENSSDYIGHSNTRKTLKIIMLYMREHPGAKLILHGHTDVLGSSEENMKLSKERVAMVKRTLRVNGINPNRMFTIAYGGTQPLINAIRGGEKNRRVEAEILCPVRLENDIKVSDIRHEEK